MSPPSWWRLLASCRRRGGGGSRAVLTSVLLLNLLCAITLYSIFTTPASTSFPAGTFSAHDQPGDAKEAGGQWAGNGRAAAGVGQFNPCPQLTARPPEPAPEQEVEEDLWKPVVPDGTYSYSAYYDARTALHSVLVLGMSRGDFPRKWCQLWYPQGRLVVVEAQYDIVPETHDALYAPSIHSCPVHPSIGRPFAVSLVVEKCDSPASHVFIHYRHPPPLPKADHNHHHVSTPTDNQYKYNFTVCVTPLNTNFNKTDQLVEMIEVNRLFGAQHFVFYDYEYSDDIQQYLEYYIERGVVTLLPWDIPVQVESQRGTPQIHYFGQVVALNDCLYRFMHTSKYIVFTDLDEIIVPYSSKSWTSIVNKKRRQATSHANIGSWMFLNTFFFTNWESNLRAWQWDGVVKYNLQSLLKTKRENTIYEAYVRSKVIVNPRLTSVIGVHFVHQFVDNFNTYTVEVSPKEALLHHYRQNFNDGLMPTYVENTRMHTFKKQIIDRVRKVYDDVG